MRLPPKRQAMARSATSGAGLDGRDRRTACDCGAPCRIFNRCASNRSWTRPGGSCGTDLSIVITTLATSARLAPISGISWWTGAAAGWAACCSRRPPGLCPAGDRWIGWHGRVRDRNRHLLVVNSRYLLFPWVTVKNLASCALGARRPAAVRRLEPAAQVPAGVVRDLCRRGPGSTPCAIGLPTGSGIGETNRKGKSRKGVYVLPLVQACRDVLRGEQPPQTATTPLTTAQKGRTGAKDRRFSRQWEELIAAATAVAAREDARWQKRRRVFNSLLIMLFVFRLVLAPRQQSYRITLCELWEHCRDAGIALPQEHPPAASSISDARAKLDPEVFRTVHREVLAHMDTDPLWKGHRIFAVDGSKFTVPRELTKDGYRTANDDTHYPHAMVSALYRLSTRIPVDFDLFAHDDERRAALTHLQHGREGDVIVYDRGYFSFDMLTAHRERGLHAVFRIPGNANPTFDAFIASQETDRVFDLAPPRKAAHLPACPVRLVKYTVAETDYCLATSLHDSQKYTIPMLADLYHGRWSIEELYKTSKTLIKEFHARSEQGIRQELYAIVHPWWQ